jgi:hypothetical protein
MVEDAEFHHRSRYTNIACKQPGKKRAVPHAYRSTQQAGRDRPKFTSKFWFNAAFFATPISQ